MSIILGDLDSAGDECFHGEFTGAINTTKLRAWCERKKRKPKPSGFMFWNATDLMREHTWDHTAQRRIDFLCANPKELAKPLLLTSWEPEGGYYVLDGWHRLRIFYEWAKRERKEFVPFMALTVTKKEAERFRLPQHAILSDVRR